MVIAECTYDEFKNVKTLLGAKFVVIYQHEADGSVFHAYAVSTENVAMHVVLDFNPADWDLLFGAASVKCASVSIV